MVKIPKLVGQLELDKGSEDKLNGPCSICGKVVGKLEDAYVGWGVRGGSHLFHLDCTRKVGLLW